MSILVAPLEALTDSLLSDPERRVLLALFSYRGKVTELVFPSLDALSERSNINDKTRISKITTSLAKKGWLTKKKKGFTGCNQYTMCMPERLTNLDSDAKLVLDTKLDADTKPNLDSDAKCDVGLSCHVQRTDQITNHINKPIPKKKKSPPLDFPVGLDSDELKFAFNDYQIMRRENKSPLTRQAVVILFNKLLKHQSEGHDPIELLENAVLNNWKSVYPKDKPANDIVVNHNGFNAKQLKNQSVTAQVLDVHNTDW